MFHSSSLNRRDFFRAGATTLAALSTGCASLGPSRPRWTIGCYTRPWDQHPYPIAFDAIAEAGYEYVGLMTAKGKSWVMITTETTPDQAGQIAHELRQRRLRAVTVYGDYKATLSVAQNLQCLHQLIDHCATCDSPDLLLGGVGENALQDPYYEAIREACPYAATRRVRLTIKPHGGRIATGPQCRQWIEKVHQPNFRLWYDPGNIFYYSDGTLSPVDDAVTVAGLVAGMSVKDFLPPKQVEVTPGTGRVDFPEVMARLREGGFQHGPLVVECVARPDPANIRAITEEARKARIFVNDLLAVVPY